MIPRVYLPSTIINESEHKMARKLTIVRKMPRTSHNGQLGLEVSFESLPANTSHRAGNWRVFEGRHSGETENEFG